MIIKNLVKVSAFYRSNLIDGLGISIMNINNNLEDIINAFIKSYEDDWNSADENERKEIVEFYINQLDHYAKLRAEGREGERNDQESLICIMNIWFLENYGFLGSDEYNGCVFLYNPKKSDI
jgi:hypothetical protein